MQLTYRSEAEEIIQRISEGNRAEFDRLVNMFHPDLAAAVWKMSAGMLRKEDVEDVIQDTWTEVYGRIVNPQGKPQYDPARASFKTYLVNIAKYRILFRMNQLKAVYRPGQQEVPEGIGDIIENLPDSEEYIPERIVLEKEEKQLRLSAYLQVLRLVFLCGGYPHQQLAFVFSKLLHGKQSARALEGKAEVIYSDLGMLPLSDVLLKAKTKIKENGDSAAAQETVSLMRPLGLRLVLTLDRLMANDWPSRNFFQSILQKTAQDTCFKDYYTVSGKPEEDNGSVKTSNIISNWVYKLEQNVKKQLGIGGSPGNSKPVDEKYEGSCSKCRFRVIPPCENKMPENFVPR